MWRIEAPFINIYLNDYEFSRGRPEDNYLFIE